MELIYYVDEYDNPTGETAEKLSAHTASTRLHAAFSCYIFNNSGELLLTQRAKNKKVWPGVWTNSCCGHPLPGETREKAVTRRVAYELGMTISNPTILVPDYRYITPPMNGIIENEYCPIFIAKTDGELDANHEEVEAFEWVSFHNPLDTLQVIEADSSRERSWWFIDQLKTIASRPDASTALKRYVASP